MILADIRNCWWKSIKNFFIGVLCLQKVTVVIGEPVDFEEDLKQLREQKKTDVRK